MNREERERRPRQWPAKRHEISFFSPMGARLGEPRSKVDLRRPKDNGSERGEKTSA